MAHSGEGRRLVLFAHQRHALRVNTEEAMGKLKCLRFAARIVQVGDSGRGTDADDVIGTFAAKGAQAANEAGNFSPYGTRVGMGLVEDQVFERSIDEHAQVFTACEQQFKLIDISEQDTRW